MEAAAINVIDIVVIVVILASALVAFIRGFIHEFLSIIGWLGGLTLGFFGSYYFKPYAMQFIKHEILAQIICGVVIFIIAMFVLSYIANRISASVKQSQLNALDRTLGFIFGFLRGFAFVVVALMIVEFIWPADKYPDLVRNAHLLPYFQKSSTYLRNFIGQYVLYVPAAQKSLESSFSTKPKDGQKNIENQTNAPISSTDDLKERMRSNFSQQDTKKDKETVSSRRNAIRQKDGYQNSDRIDLENLFDETNKEN